MLTKSNSGTKGIFVGYSTLVYSYIVCLPAVRSISGSVETVVTSRIAWEENEPGSAECWKR